MEKKLKAFVHSVRIKKVTDEDSDLSHLGEFANQSDGKFSIEHEPGNNRTFNWFNAANVENMEQAKQNYERARTYGESWSMVGVVAIATVYIPFKNGKEVNYKTQEMESGGLWGIESDSDAPYFNEVGQEQINSLKEYLQTMCIGLKGWKQMCKKAMSDFLLKD